MAKLIDVAAIGPLAFPIAGVPGVHTESQDLTENTSLMNLGVGCRWFRLAIYQRGFTGGTGTTSQHYMLTATGDSTNAKPITVCSLYLPRKAEVSGIVWGCVPIATYLSRVAIILGTAGSDTLSYDFILDATP